MTPPKTFDAGKLTAELSAMTTILGEIKTELVKMRDWQISIETRLATGSQKFKEIEKDISDLQINSKRQLLDDRAVLVRATAWGAGIGSLIGIVVAAVLNLVIG